MQILVVILLLVLGVFLILPIVAMVTVGSTSRRLREEMAGIMDRIRDLEAQLRPLLAERSGAAATPNQAAHVARAAPAPLAVASPPAVAASTGVKAQPPAVAAPAAQEWKAPAAPAQPVPPPSFAQPSVPPIAFPPPAPPPPPHFATLDEPTTAVDVESLESRIGSQWFNRIGILAVLIGVAWFLKLAFDNHWIGPIGRVFSGLLAGVALIVWSERFLKRGFAAFSYSLKAIGSGTLYLSLWAAYQIYSLLSASTAFAAMIAVTAFNGVMAWTQDSELLALYAIAGGLATPLLVATGGNHEIALFTYLLVLDLAVLVLVALRPWSRLLFLAAAGTAVFVLAWWFQFYGPWQATRTAFFLCCFFLAFSLAPRLVHAPLDASGAMRNCDALALVVMPLANAALSFLGLYYLLAPSVVNWAGPWLAVAFAAYYLLLARLPQRGILRAGPALLASLHVAVAIVFLTLAIPLKTQGRWMTIGWLLEGAVLLWLSTRVRSSLVRAFALVSLVLGLGSLLAMNPPASLRPIFNERFGTYCVAIAACAFMVWLARNSCDAEAPSPAMQWPNLAAAGVLAVNALILIAFSWEIHSFWWYLRWRGDYRLLQNYEMYAQFSYSALFMIYGAVLLTIGFVRRSAFLRWQALVLLAATIAKVFLVDTSQLSGGSRILSFIGLGVLLLAISFAYQRDWLNLRGRKEEPS